MKVQLIRYLDLDNTNTRLAQSLNEKQGVLPPLGLGYIASSLEKAGFEVDIIDAIALAISKEEVSKRIKEFDPHIVGITAMTPTIKGAFEAAEVAKKLGKITIIGGVHMSIFPLETLQRNSVDFGIVGEGEESMVQFCKAIENDDSYENVEGLCYKKDGRIIIGQPKFISDVDSVPMPSYHLLPMKKYSSIIASLKPCIWRFCWRSFFTYSTCWATIVPGTSNAFSSTSSDGLADASASTDGKQVVIDADTSGITAGDLHLVVICSVTLNGVVGDGIMATYATVDSFSGGLLKYDRQITTLATTVAAKDHLAIFKVNRNYSRLSSFTKKINVYSFALKPEEHQPSGTCNFSRIDNAKLMTTTALAAADNIYAVNYNVLRIMSGMGGLAYSN